MVLGGVVKNGILVDGLAFLVRGFFDVFNELMAALALAEKHMYGSIP